MREIRGYNRWSKGSVPEVQKKGKVTHSVLITGLTEEVEFKLAIE